MGHVDEGRQHRFANRRLQIPQPLTEDHQSARGEGSHPLRHATNDVENALGERAQGGSRQTQAATRPANSRASKVGEPPPLFIEVFKDRGGWTKPPLPPATTSASI